MKKIISIFAILLSFAFTSNSYSKTEIHWWYGNSGFLGDVIIEIANRFNDSQDEYMVCLLYTSPSPRDLSTSRMPSSA